MALDYLDPFRTTEFKYTKDSVVDIEIQTSYDGSVNIITTSEKTIPRIVNSRQNFNKKNVTLIERSNDNLDNVYSDDTIDKTKLIPTLGDMVPELHFDSVTENKGVLTNGGYIYYFKLKTADGTESPIIEESRLISIHEGNEFGKAHTYSDTRKTTNAVQFTIKELTNKIYKYCSVYFVRMVGMTGNVVKSAYKIEQDYAIVDEECVILHTGREPEISIDLSEITAEYTPMSSAGTLTQKNNRLLLGNIKTYDIADDILKEAALHCYIRPKDHYADIIGTVEQKMTDGGYIDDTYSKASKIYNHLSYFPQETYEFAINFVFENGSVSAAYPIMGFDYKEGGSKSIDLSLLGTDIDWELDPSASNYTQNSHGVVRMWDVPIADICSKSQPIDTPSGSLKKGVTYTVGGTGTGIKIGMFPVKTYLIGETFVNDWHFSYTKIDGTEKVIATPVFDTIDIHTLTIDTTSMVNNFIPELEKLGIKSYFVSRTERIPDLLMEGLITPTATATLGKNSNKEMAHYNLGMHLGYGNKGALSTKLLVHPVPGNAIPYSTERIDTENSSEESATSFDAVLYAPIPEPTNAKYAAIYSPDITCDTSIASFLNSKSVERIRIDSVLKQKVMFTIPDAISRHTDDTLGSGKYAYASSPYEFSNNPSTIYDVKKIKYVADGAIGFSNMDFTGKLDRQSAILLRHTVKSNTSFTDTLGDVNTQATQYALWVSERDANDQTYTSTGKPIDNNEKNSMLTGVTYSPYLGIEFSEQSAFSNIAIPFVANGGNSYFTAFGYEAERIPSPGVVAMGGIARIYKTGSGALSKSNWLDLYKVNRRHTYTAISPREKITTSLGTTGATKSGKLTGGDCYVGFYYQRVWRPSGIAGVPTASDPFLYMKDEDDVYTREGVNITNSGYTIGFPVRSRYNFAIRALDEADEVEMKLYGTGRSYSYGGVDEKVHGNRQPETSIINYGNMDNTSVLQHQSIDLSAPFLEHEYQNRVITSEISITGEFENGYRDFRGLNFKDYDEDLGEIVAITSSGLYTYVVYTNGVAIIEVSERSAITSEETGVNVYIGAADVLPPKSTPVFTTLGSQHLHSIVNTENGIYGVDVDAKKIWTVNVKEKKVISDYKIQSILNRLITDELDDVMGSYDVVYGEITFTFIYKDKSQKAILYAIADDLWCGTTDIYKLYQFNIEDVQLSIQKPTLLYNLYYPSINKYHEPNNPIYPRIGVRTIIIDDPSIGGAYNLYNSYIEFVLKQENLEKFDLSNIIINGVGTPTSIDIVSDDTHKYTIGPNSTGTISQTIPLHTNIFMRDATEFDVSLLDNHTIARISNDAYRALNREDQITLELEKTSGELVMQQFTIADITNESGVDTITLSQDIITDAVDVKTIFYGWKVPIRISLGEIAAGKTKISIPTEKQANLIQGITKNSQGYRNNQSNALPYGR